MNELMERLDELYVEFNSEVRGDTAEEILSVEAELLSAGVKAEEYELSASTIAALQGAISDMKEQLEEEYDDFTAEELSKLEKFAEQKKLARIW